MSSALLIFWFLMPWPWGRAIGGIYLGLMVLATLGSGQHYLFDLICAVPYATLVIWVVRILDVRLPAAIAIRLERSEP
jgi:membrane-associated phospholipid phosphatase